MVKRKAGPGRKTSLFPQPRPVVPVQSTQETQLAFRGTDGINGQYAVRDDTQHLGFGWVTLNVWTITHKTTDQTVQNNSDVADTALTIALLASTRYVIRGRIWWTSGPTPDFLWYFAGPAGDYRIQLTHFTAGGGSTSSNALNALPAPITDAGAAALAVGFITFDAEVLVGGAGGDFVFHFGQNTLDASDTTSLAGSYLEHMAVA
jgi:hypothetical protein